MFIPQMLGLLAVALFATAAILAVTRAVKPSRRLAVAGLAVAALGVVLALETEIRHRSCVAWNGDHVRYKDVIPVGDDPVAPGSPRPRDCERWPW